MLPALDHLHTILHQVVDNQLFGPQFTIDCQSCSHPFIPHPLPILLSFYRHSVHPPRSAAKHSLSIIGINHIALRLESGSYEEVKAHLEANGHKVTGRPGGDRCIYCDDPDGHRVQLLYPGARD